MVVSIRPEARHKAAEPTKEQGYPILYERLLKATDGCLNYSGQELGKSELELLGVGNGALLAPDKPTGLELKMELDERATAMEPDERMQFAISLASAMPGIKSDLYRELVRRSVVLMVREEGSRLCATTSQDASCAVGLGKIGDVLMNLGDSEPGRLCKERARKKRKYFFPLSEQDVKSLDLHGVEAIFCPGKDCAKQMVKAKCLSELVVSKVEEDKSHAKMRVYPLTRRWYEFLTQIPQIVSDLKATKHYRRYFTEIERAKKKREGNGIRDECYFTEATDTPTTKEKAKEFEKIYMITSWKEADEHKLEPITGEMAFACFSDWLRHSVYLREAYLAEGKAAWGQIPEEGRRGFEQLFVSIALIGDGPENVRNADPEVSDFLYTKEAMARLDFAEGAFRFSGLSVKNRERLLGEFFPRFWARFRMGEFDGSWREAVGATPNISPLAVARIATTEDWKTANRRMRQSRGAQSAKQSYQGYFSEQMRVLGWLE